MKSTNSKNCHRNGPRPNESNPNVRNLRFIINAFCLAGHGPEEAKQYVHNLLVSQNAQLRGELIRELGTAETREQDLEGEIGRMERCQQEGLPYPPSAAVPTFPAGFRARVGMALLGSGLITVAVYAAIFFRLVGAPATGADVLKLVPLLGAQLAAEALGIAIISGCIVRLLKPGVGANLVQSLAEARRERATLTGTVAGLVVRLEGLKAGENAAVTEAAIMAELAKKAAEAE